MADLTFAQHRALVALERRPGFVHTSVERVLLRLGLAEPTQPGSWRLQLTDAGRAAAASPAPPFRPTRLQAECLEAIAAGGRGFVHSSRSTTRVRLNLTDAGLVRPNGASTWELTEAGHVVLAEWVERQANAGRR